MRNFILCFLFLITFGASAKTTCSWCIENNPNFKSLLNLTPSDLLKNIESNKINVKIFQSKNLSAHKYFEWGKIRIDKGNMVEVSKYEGSLGKTFCKGERGFNESEYTIVVSSDAPYSTLLHEYMHVIQIKNNPKWCKISERLGKNSITTDQDYIAVRDHEWDVRKALWKLIDHKNFNIEDKILICEGLIREAKLRSSFDNESLKWISENKIEAKMQDLIKQYTKSLKK